MTRHLAIVLSAAALLAPAAGAYAVPQDSSSVARPTIQLGGRVLLPSARPLAKTPRHKAGTFGTPKAYHGDFGSRQL